MNTAVVDITGNGVVGATISVSGSGDFGTVIATRTLDRTFTVTNGSPTETTGTLSYSVSGSSRFTLVAGGTCPASGTGTIAGGGSCTIIARYSPLVPDSTTVAQTGTLTVQQGVETRNVALTGLAGSQLTLTPATASFMTGVGTTSATQMFTVTNVGLGTTGSIVVAVNGFPAEFPVTMNTCTTLTAGATCTFLVAFAPTAPVDRTGVELRVSNGAYVANTARVDVSLLSGDAASQPALVASPVTTDPPGSPDCGFNECGSNPRVWFGRVIEGANSDTFRFTVTNTGDLPTGALSATVAATPAHFDVVATTCSGVLAGGASCTVDVRFSPPLGTADTIQDGTIRVAGTPGGMIDMFVSGVSINSGAPTMTPTPEDFGRTPGGVPVGPRTMMVSNNTAGALSVTAIFMFGVDAARFTITPGSCTVGLSVPAGGTCTVTVTYNPPAGTDFGFHQATAIVAFPGGSDDAEASVVGVSLVPAAITLSPSGTVTYPDTTSGQASSRTFTVTNTGEVATAATPSPALGGADPSQFAIVRNMCTAPLAGGASCTFDVEFRPTGAGVRSASLTVTAGGGLMASATLTGTGLAPALLGISPSALQTCPDHFAGTDVFSCVSWTITNGGGSTAPLTSMITSDYRVAAASTCVSSPNLAAGGMCTVIAEHTPTDVGADNGTVTVSSPGISSVMGTVASNGIPALERTAGSPDFGSSAVMGSGVGRTFTLRNQANPATTILTYSVTGTHAADFDVIDDNCSGRTLSSGATCDMTVRFLPSAAGARTATLTVTDGSGNKTEVIAMMGTGT
jgi:hypothetical protein